MSETFKNEQMTTNRLCLTSRCVNVAGLLILRPPLQYKSSSVIINTLNSSILVIDLAAKCKSGQVLPHSHPSVLSGPSRWNQCSKNDGCTFYFIEVLIQLCDHFGGCSLFVYTSVVAQITAPKISLCWIDTRLKCFQQNNITFMRGVFIAALLN